MKLFPEVIKLLIFIQSNFHDNDIGENPEAIVLEKTTLQEIIKNGRYGEQDGVKE